MTSRQGDPTFLILASLAAGPRHGYGIIQDIEEFAGVRLGPGTLYGVLSRLEARGLIEPLPAEDRRHPYQLTTSGREEAMLQLRAMDGAVRVSKKRLEGIG